MPAINDVLTENPGTYSGAIFEGQIYEPYTEARFANAFTIPILTARFSAGAAIVLERYVNVNGLQGWVGEVEAEGGGRGGGGCYTRYVCMTSAEKEY